MVGQPTKFHKIPHFSTGTFILNTSTTWQVAMTMMAQQTQA
jgi:hypothetical protein